MHILLMIAIALFLGIVVAGFVWLAWSFTENMLAGLAAARARKDARAAGDAAQDAE